MHKGNKRRFAEKQESNKKTSVCSESNICINELYQSEDFVKSFSNAFSENCDFDFSNGAKLQSKPFRSCILPNFLSSNDYLNKLKRELLSLNMHEKNNDLYQFKQSDDLDSVSTPHISTLRKAIYEDCLPVISKITNIPLNTKVDMTCSMYNYSDVLLCHDDQLFGRRIAFIFYLVPDWDVKDGGSLDLFNSENGKPSDIVCSLYPVWNNFVFFEVSSVSFHQVSEILSDKSRLSISGWYHGPSIQSESFVEETKYLSAPIDFKGDVREWLNPTYLQPDIQIQIRQSFKENSEIELSDFLQPNKYSEVAHSLGNCNENWKLIGPANARCYEELYVSADPVKDCLQVLQSEAMCLILSNLTGLSLHEMAVVDSSDSSEESDDEHNEAKNAQTKIENKSHNAQISSSVRKWSHKCYTLLRDDKNSNCCLDGTLFFNCNDWDSDCGGYTSYIAKGEVDELLRVDPKPNHFALVYTDEGTSRFVKYVNSTVLVRDQPNFQDVFVTYFEH